MARGRRRVFVVPLLSVLAVAVAVAAWLLPRQDAAEVATSPDRIPFVPGRNNTVLFLTNTEHGLRNAILATASSLLSQHADIEVHIGGFSSLEPRINEIEHWARRTSPAATIKFHQLPAESYGDTVFTDGRSIQDLVHPPGFFGALKFGQFVPQFFMPWAASTYLEIYRTIGSILDEVDPAVVAIDPALTPAIDAVRYRNRNYLILSTNTIKENGAAEQGLAMLWKYPAFATGYPFPVPWYLIPANIFANIRMVVSIMRARHIKERETWLQDHGLNVTTSAVDPPCRDAPLCITQTLMQADYPFNVPQKYRTYGPMVLSLATAAEQDEELVSWMQRAPTVLINLGSVFSWEADMTRTMATALKTVLSEHNIQVLWKLKRRSAFADSVFEEVLGDEIESQRMRVVSWVKADPTSLMETGHVVLAVHHGGASSFFEPLSVGISQLILPFWADCYDAAVRAEHIGVGIWGNRHHAPQLDVNELVAAFGRLLGDSEQATTLRRRAVEIGEICQKKPGRDLAAGHVAHIARGGAPLEYRSEAE